MNKNQKWRLRYSRAFDDGGDIRLSSKDHYFGSRLDALDFLKDQGYTEIESRVFLKIWVGADCNHQYILECSVFCD